jgi:hypothetical protein
VQTADFEQDSGVTSSLRALQLLGRYLGSFPGRKSVIWLSGSFPSVVFSGKGQSDWAHNYSEDLRKTSVVLTAARVALFPIDVRGVKPDGYYDAANPPQRLGGQLNTTAETAGLQTDSMQRNGAHATMDELAAGTGGRAFYNNNGIEEAMSSVTDHRKYFYTVAYSPSNRKMDGSFRSISVKLVKDNYKLRYRSGYFADDDRARRADLQTEGADPLQPFMSFGMPNFDQILFKVLVEPTAVQPPTGAAIAGSSARLVGPVTRYGVDFAIPMADLLFASTPDGSHYGTVTLALYAHNRSGQTVNSIEQSIEIKLTDEAYAKASQNGLQLHQELDVPKSEIWLRIGVYDPANMRVGTMEISLHQSAVKDVKISSQTSLPK